LSIDKRLAPQQREREGEREREREREKDDLGRLQGRRAAFEIVNKTV
jgi:hypothetical protein